MNKKIVFCKIGWMKEYMGANEKDNPINVGDHINNLKKRGEFYTFLDNNGRCHGYIEAGKNMPLEEMFKGVEANEHYLENVFVVWLASNEKQQTKIIGWYSDARIYRRPRKLLYFTDQEASSYYNIEAAASDCYLLAEKERIFQVNAFDGKANKSNIWIPRSQKDIDDILSWVLEYIVNYDRGYYNYIYRDENIEKRVRELESTRSFQELYDKGLEYYKLEEYYIAMIYFKAASKKQDSADLLKKLGKSLYLIYRYDKAREIFEKVIDLEGENLSSLFYLLLCFDSLENRWKTLEYANKIIELPENSDKNIIYKKMMYLIKFDIYICYQEYKNAEKVMYEYEEYLEELRLINDELA